MRCQEVVSVWDKNINSWISKVKKYKETMANEQNQNGRGEYKIDKITYAKEVLLLMVESHELWTLYKSNLDSDKQLCYCTCLLETFEINYLREKYNKRSAVPLMPSIDFCILLCGS